jgi:hypothetical protein
VFINNRLRGVTRDGRETGVDKIYGNDLCVEAFLIQNNELADGMANA